MKKKVKPLCKSSELGEPENREQLREIVLKPKFFCKKCLRVASVKGALCKPEKLKDKKKKSTENVDTTHIQEQQ